ncbi:MAG: hypothetical protein JW863_04220 [Chitinispirillaceae bacterium]|nr:hypothetical protein [Chitinispirillaceae bacterium]
MDPRSGFFKQLRPDTMMVVTILISGMFMFPGAQTVTIDETQPGTIPEQYVADWEAQDGTNYDGNITKIKNSLSSAYAAKITGTGKAGYLSAAHWRRVSRMQPYARYLKKLIYARHHDIGGVIIGYTEDLNSDGSRGLGDWGMGGMSKSSDYNNGNKGGTAIHLLEFDDYYPQPTDIITDSKGVLRDPCPSYDGKTIVYAHSKDNNGYHICDINLETKETRQLTDDPSTSLKVSDMEPCVTPRGDIIFQSSRCFGHVDCNINLVSNLYIINKDGKYLRRIGYDQVSTFYPTMMENGQVMYSRWEYNDRNVANVFGIFTMNQDGTRQNEFFGNQTSWPATFSQAHQIPGTGNEMKALAIIGGHMGPYAGDLVLVDASKVRNGSSGVKLIAPERANGTGSVYDMNGVPDEDKLFQNPYPLDEEWFLISYRITRKSRFQIFLMNIKGERELVATGGTQSVSQPVSLAPRDIPIVPALQADYTKDYAEVAVANVYYGAGITGVTSGIKKVRVCAMEYRTDPAFGNTGSQSYQMTPVGRFGCSWEAKWIVGEAPVADDGSAAFKVPPRIPLFLQLIADDGTCVQTMRSWMTLQPGERFDCYGCHENKNAAPPSGVNPANLVAKSLEPFFDLSGKKGSFYYPEVVQPVLTKNCVKSGCHDNSHAMPLVDTKVWSGDLSDPDDKPAYRFWNKSYIGLFDKISCNAIFGGAEGLRPRSVGSARSKVITTLKGGHKSVSLSEEEMGKLCAWIDLSGPHSGTYTDDMREEDIPKYLERLKRRETEEAIEAKNIQQFIEDGQWGDVGVLDPGMPGAQVTRNGSITGLSVRFSVTENLLSFTVPSEGNVKLLDLQGRQILVRTISREAFLESAVRTIRLNIPAGTYIVKFNGVENTSQEVVSIL